MSIAKNILSWSDKQFDEVLNNPKCKHPYIKSAMCGAIEGAIDAAIIAYPIFMIGCYYWKYQALKK